MRIMAFPLEAQEVASQEGFQRATVWIPNESQILHLGTAYPSQVIALFALAPPPPKAPDGTEVAYDKSDLVHLEFIVAVPGADIPPGYVLRAPVRTEGGLIFLFEKKHSGLVISSSRGVG